MDSPHEITELLLAWEQGDQEALERLALLVEGELRLLAKRYMKKEKKGHLLQTTALVNEAWLRLIDQTRVHWKNRAQFYAIAAMCMRRVLIDHARVQVRGKRGGGAEHIDLSDAPPLPVDHSVDLLALDEVLQKLAKQDARQSQIVEMRFFGGYSVKEVAEILKVSEATIEREWRMARAWLQRELGARPKAARADDP